MRAAHRAFVLVLTILLSVIAMPAYADNDSPGLLETVGKTVDTVTAPIVKPKAVASADPVKQLTTIVDSTVGTSLSTDPLVTTVEAVVAAPAPAAPVELTEGVVEAPVRELAAPAVLAADRGTAVHLRADSFAGLRFTESSTARTVSVAPAKADAGQTPRTSTLPDGGSPLTLAWLMLAFGTTALGVLVIHRSRTA